MTDQFDDEFQDDLGPSKSQLKREMHALQDLGKRMLDLNDEAAAIHSITDWLLEWFQSAANVSADVPDRKLLPPYARKIFNHLTNRPSREGR